MDERTRRHQASPSRAGTAGRTRRSVSKDILMNGQPYPRVGGCVWYHFIHRGVGLRCLATAGPDEKKNVGAARCCTPTDKDSSVPKPMFTLIFLVLVLADPQQAQRMRQRSRNAVCWSSSADRTSWVSSLYAPLGSHHEVALMLPCGRRDERVCNIFQSGYVKQIVEVLVRRPEQA